MGYGDPGTAAFSYSTIGSSGSSGQLPSYAGNRNSPYRSNYVYGSKAALQQLRVAMAKLLYTPSSLKSILCVGDSQTAGVNGGPGVTDWPISLRKLLSVNGFQIGGTGWVIIGNNATPDPRWTFTGGSWTGVGNKGQWLTAPANGATATFTSDLPGTVAEVCVSDSAGTWTVTIDGVAQTGITTGGTSTWKVVTYSGLSNAPHTIVLTATAFANASVAAARVRGTGGVQITNNGVSGAWATDWVASSNGAVWYNLFKTTASYEPSPALTIVMVGGNDALNAQTTAQMKTSLQAVVQAYQAVSPVVMAWYTPSTIATTYTSVAYDVADATNTVLIDNTDSLTDLATMVGFGLNSGDNIHPNATGYQYVARTMYNALTS